MLYAILRAPGKTVGGCLWKDLRTVQGYQRRAHRSPVLRGWTLEVYRSEHPDHVYGNDKLVYSGVAK